jgi:hypothetical protein
VRTNYEILSFVVRGASNYLWDLGDRRAYRAEVPCIKSQRRIHEADEDGHFNQRADDSSKRLLT